MAQVRTRQDVWKLDEWHPTLLWYARAIGEMQRRTINDPTSWRYQSAIHDYVIGNDPNASASDVLPPPLEQQRFWRQCQHSSWFFLPWHRMYLAFFEQIVAATVRLLGGPADWALPYWNYSDSSNPNARLLPPAFRATNLPDGSENSLRVEQRGVGVNEGEEFIFDEDVDLVVCLTEESFISAPFGGDPGFGGRRTVFNHSGGPAGDLERVPHGSMHVAVGGDFGWMSAFDTAALDPIFWLHHCNLDRLWTVWLNRDSQHLNPVESQWLTSVSFDFHDGNGGEVSMTCLQVTDTIASPLSYQYQDVSDPLGVPPTEAARRSGMEDSRIPEMVGATDQPLTLTGESATARVPVSQPTGPASPSESGALPKRVFLNIENITSTGQPGSYLVYLNVPPGEDPRDHKELFAGLLPMFGVTESSDATRDHPANGLHYALEITHIVRLLESRKEWDPNAMHVTFVPQRRPTAGRETAAARAPVRVGRISLYYS
jgi:tyrosinase